jgi:two-component system, response regulator, stage 0 sporulation protein F
MSKIKIHYIDDEEINLQLFEYNFSRKYEVITDNNGNEGLLSLEKHPDIQVVISDMKMPHMNGLEFISKAKEKYNDKRYFILTGFDFTAEIQKAIESKLIVSYFRKPFNIREIEAAIDEVVKLS